MISPTHIFRISDGTRNSARREKTNAVKRFDTMAQAVAELVKASDWQKVADWLSNPDNADLTEPRTAEELAAQWREHKETK